MTDYQLATSQIKCRLYNSAQAKHDKFNDVLIDRLLYALDGQMQNIQDFIMQDYHSKLALDKDLTDLQKEFANDFLKTILSRAETFVNNQTREWLAREEKTAVEEIRQNLDDIASKASLDQACDFMFELLQGWDNHEKVQEFLEEHSGYAFS